MIVCSTVLPARSVALARNDTEVPSFGCWTMANTFATTVAAVQVWPPSNDASTVSDLGTVPWPLFWACTDTGTMNDSPAGAEFVASSAGVYRTVDNGSRT